MNKLALVMVLVVIAAAAAVRPQAQVQAAHVAVVDTQWLLLQHPAGQRVRELQVRAEQELLPMLQELEAIQLRARSGQALSHEQVERFELLRVTLEHAQAAWRTDTEAAAAPAIAAVEAAIESVARRHAFSVVFDTGASGPSGAGTIVYIDPNVDITPTVLAELGAE